MDLQDQTSNVQVSMVQLEMESLPSTSALESSSQTLCANFQEHKYPGKSVQQIQPVYYIGRNYPPVVDCQDEYDRINRMSNIKKGKYY